MNNPLIATYRATTYRVPSLELGLCLGEPSPPPIPDRSAYLRKKTVVVTRSCGPT